MCVNVFVAMNLAYQFNVFEGAITMTILIWYHSLGPGVYFCKSNLYRIYLFNIVPLMWFVDGWLYIIAKYMILLWIIDEFLLDEFCWTDIMFEYAYIKTAASNTSNIQWPAWKRRCRFLLSTWCINVRLTRHEAHNFVESFRFYRMNAMNTAIPMTITMLSLFLFTCCVTFCDGPYRSLLSDLSTNWQPDIAGFIVLVNMPAPLM